MPAEKREDETMEAYVIRAIREEERELCAKIAETFPDDIMVLVDRPGGPPGNFYRKSEKKDIANAIRRGSR